MMDPFDLKLWEGFQRAGGRLDLPAITDQITIDTQRISSKNALFVALKGAHNDGHNFLPQAIAAGARYALVKKGWKPAIPLQGIQLLYVDDPLTAFQEIAAAYRRQKKCHVVAIAGSYGKTMVKDLLQTMLSQTHLVVASPESFNSQIGVPLSLLTIKDTHAIALIEVAISHPQEMDVLSHMVGAHSTIITHIGKKHTVTLGGLENVAKEILKIATLSPEKNWSVFPKDPHLLAALAASPQPSRCGTTHFWNEYSSNLPHTSFTSPEHRSPISYQIDFPDGAHHTGHITSGFYYFLDLINITTKAAWLLGGSSSCISQAMRNYTPEPMRTEIWKSALGSTFINDTYCSDPQSVDKALQLLQQEPPTATKIFAFGGMRGNEERETDYRRVGKAIAKAKIGKLYLYGPHHYAPLIDEVKRLSSQTTIVERPTFEEVLTEMRKQIKQDDVILVKADRKHPLDTLVQAFDDGLNGNQLIVNLEAIAENLKRLRSKIDPGTRLMVMVKALAYGTNDMRVAKFLEMCGIPILGVSCVDEAIALRRASVKQEIFVISAALFETHKVIKWDLEVGISDSAMIEALAEEAAKQHKIAKVHLHVDTGMRRFGCRPEEALQLAHLITSLPSLKLEGIMTHFACADLPEQDPFTLQQAAQFDAVIDELGKHNIHPQWRHAANSSAAVRFHFPQYNMARLGLGVYGLYSSVATKNALELRLALSLVSRIVGINTCRMGETISYGRCYAVNQDVQKIAVLPIGYFDGLHRNYSGKGHVIIRGQKAPMVGTICMDFMMVDVTNIPNASTGDPVLIFGEDEYGHYLSPEELASKGDSIIHELISCLGPRIPRIFVHEEKQQHH